jgi:hypothetical protein
MTDNVRTRGLAFAKFLSGLSPEERKRANERSQKEALEQHKLFSENFKAGECSFCGEPLTAFDVMKPCRHRLLKPDGFGKEHFELLARKHSLSVLRITCDGRPTRRQSCGISTTSQTRARAKSLN